MRAGIVTPPFRATFTAPSMNNTILARRVKNPRITLYAFHRRHSLAEGPQQVVENAAYLWEKLAAVGEKYLPFPELQSLRDKLSCYQNGEYNPDGEKRQRGDRIELIQPTGCLLFEPVPLENGSNLSGLIYPFKLHDTYAAELTLQYKTTTVPISDLSRFNPHGCLLPQHIGASLGQTLLLFAELGDDASGDRNVADACVEALLPDSTGAGIECIAQGRLFASPIFEYDVLSKSEVQSPNEQCHILVWLNHGQPKTLVMAQKAYFPLLNLLCCRHKILYAYHESRQRNREARQRYYELEQQVHNFQTLLGETSQLYGVGKELLSQMPARAFQYACDLRDLEDDGTAIANNAKNYEARLGEIQELSQAGDDVRFLQNFHDRTCNQFQTQIQVDLSYLVPGRNLFEQMIASIRGIVEIERAECDLHRDRQRQQDEKASEFSDTQQNDRPLLERVPSKNIDEQQELTHQLHSYQKELERNLVHTIEAVGAGLAAGLIVASSFSQIIVTWRSPFSNPSPHLPFLLLSPILSTFAAVGMWWSLKLWQQRNREEL